jgi:predicted metalloprotease
MKWKGKRASTNVDDARGRRSVSKAGSSAGVGMLMNFVMRRFGIKGILVMVVVGVVLWKAGIVDPAQLVGGQTLTQSVDYKPSAEEQELFDFVTVVLGYTEDVWKSEFLRHDSQYQEPVLGILPRLM